MSFPRAKIKRFNDIQVTTPSPADYNVDSKQKPKLCSKLQQERSADCKSPPLSEAESTQSTPCFRTPNIVKKRTTLGSASKVKLSDRELLNEKTVECRNKDNFIRELTEQLEELKNQLYSVQCEKDAIYKEKEKFESEISELMSAHNVAIQHLCAKHKAEMSDVNSQISLLESDLELLRNTNAVLDGENLKLCIMQEEITSCGKKINDKDALLKQLQETLENLEEEKRIMEKKHKDEIDDIRNKHNTELQSVEVKMLNNVHDMQMALDEQKLQSQLKMKELEESFQNEINNLMISFEEEKKNIDNRNSEYVSQLEEKMNEIKLISEIQTAEKCSEVESYWKKKLEHKEKESNEILKECQAISEYNIIQSEIEKNKYKSEFEDCLNKYRVLEKKYDDVYLKYRKLQSSYSDAQNKLYRLIKEVREKKELKNQIDQIISEKQTYLQTIARCQQTIDILTNRLKESDQDVEQLKNEIANNEKKLLEYEHKFNIMSDELKELIFLNETLEMNNESYLKVTQEEIARLEGDLLKKVEDIKLISGNEIKKYQKKLHILGDEKEDLSKMLEKYQVLSLESKSLLHELDKNIERLTSEKSEYVKQIDNLKYENEDLKCALKVFTEKEGTWTIEKKELDLKIDILKNELNQMRIREEQWLQATTEVEEMKIEHEDYKLKQNFLIQKLEEQISTLKDNYEQLEEDSEKILNKKNLNLESKLKIQDEVLEKLKKDNADLKRSIKKLTKYNDKENIGSPNKSFKCDSPGPLKNLN